MQLREQGLIKRWYTERHFGFIGRTGEQDLFFHLSDVVFRGDEVVQEGRRVEFAVTADQLGRPRASGVGLL
jgi:cold shock CspA family protein